MNPLKNSLLKLFVKFIKHDLVQKQLDYEFYARNKPLHIDKNLTTPYKEISASSNDSTKESSVIFITGRFRSGSTLLWNVFRQIETCTAYYEPFNERRWFDSVLRGQRVDKTHIGVNDYWSEYDGMSELGKYYSENWIREELLMDKMSWNPKMLAFINYLIDQAKGIPVLQFNRTDFRLPWLRHYYPSSHIIHLYRNPRDQWLSFLKDKSLMNKHDVERTYIDSFYLDVWCNDLAKFFPFLSLSESPHPYQRFYYLWKLSYLYGVKYADYSICFEELIASPKEILNKIFQMIKYDQEIPWDNVLNIIQNPQIGKWKGYADHSWFSHHEEICEATLTSFFK